MIIENKLAGDYICPMMGGLRCRGELCAVWMKDRIKNPRYMPQSHTPHTPYEQEFIDSDTRGRCGLAR